MVKEDLKDCIVDIERERSKALRIGCDRQTLIRGPFKPLQDRPPKTKREKAKYHIGSGEFPQPVLRGSVDAFIKK